LFVQPDIEKAIADEHAALLLVDGWFGLCTTASWVEAGGKCLHKWNCRIFTGSSQPGCIELCLTCHGPSSPNGPHAATIEAHTHHKADSTGSECVSCHMPKIEQTIADINVRSHTFNFIAPEMTDQYKIPNSCNTCHTDKTTDWARQTLKGWTGISP
jgi:hypothetical protein